MIELRDRALAIAATLLAARVPGPFGVDLWGLSPEGAARLVGMVIEECGDAGLALAGVRVDPFVAVAMGGSPGGRPWPCGGTLVEADAALFQRVEFRRSA